jgi:hypothetical protein
MWSTIQKTDVFIRCFPAVKLALSRGFPILINPWFFNVSWVVQPVMVQCSLSLFNQRVFKFPSVFNQSVNFLLFYQWVLKYQSLQPASVQVSVCVQPASVQVSVCVQLASKFPSFRSMGFEILFSSTSEFSNFIPSVQPVSVQVKFSLLNQWVFDIQSFLRVRDTGSVILIIRWLFNSIPSLREMCVGDSGENRPPRRLRVSWDLWVRGPSKRVEY